MSIFASLNKKRKVMKVGFTTYSRENSQLLFNRISNCKSVSNCQIINDFEYIVDFKSGTPFAVINRVANGQTMYCV